MASMMTRQLLAAGVMIGSRSCVTSEISTDGGRERENHVVFGLIEKLKAKIQHMPQALERRSTSLCERL